MSLLDSFGLRLRAARMFWILAAIFYLNDFLFIWASGEPNLYFIDSALRCALILLCLSLPQYRQLALSVPSFKPMRWYSILLLLSMLVVLNRMAHVFIESVIVEHFGTTNLFYFGRIENISFRVFDLTFGLMLVAISEELVFRKFALHWLRSAGFCTIATVLISAVVFATMHWGSGLHRVASTFIFGIVSMRIYMRYEKLWPLIVAHYITNFIAFADFD